MIDLLPYVVAGWAVLWCAVALVVGVALLLDR
jgi:hypothetical protein